MKKIVKFSLIMLLAIVCCTGAVYAASSCNISLETTKLEFSPNEEFSVDVKISNIESERGFIALEAVLEYDKSSLTLLEMQGQNGWSSPIKDLSYNEATGKLVIDKNGLAKSDEVILKLTFKVNENSTGNASIALKDIKASDATAPVEVATASKNITIKSVIDPIIPVEPTTPTQPDDTNQNTITDTTTNTNTNTNTTVDNTILKDTMPKTGTNSELLIGLVAVVTIVGIVFGIKMNEMNKITK